jgi:hypothetical protein
MCDSNMHGERIKILSLVTGDTLHSPLNIYSTITPTYVFFVYYYSTSNRNKISQNKIK